MRDESLIGKKNAKYLEVMSKLDDGEFTFPEATLFKVGTQLRPVNQYKLAIRFMFHDI